MKSGAIRVLRAALGVSVFLLFGCAGNSHKDSADAAKAKSYTDPASGVVLPERVDTLERTALNKEATDKAPVSAAYGTTTDEVVSANISMIPTSSTTPDQLLGQTIRSIQNQPNFVQNDYRGVKSFGAEKVYCTQCSFDQPPSGERVTYKIVMIPHGDYLVCFTFQVPAAREQQAQGIIDGFIQTIVSKSMKQDYMMPVTTGTEE